MKRKSARPSFSRRPSFNKREKTDKGGRIRQRNQRLALLVLLLLLVVAAPAPQAPQAAGKIHSDFERGFIRAEVVNYQDLLDCGSYTAAKEKGLVGLEGKEYVVKDGDVILFRFNV